MSINELNNGSVGSWSQFVSLKEAASKRNFGPGAKGSANAAAAANAAGGAKFSEILSSKGGGDVFLNQAAANAFHETLTAVRAKDLPAKGKLFDSFA